MLKFSGELKVWILMSSNTETRELWLGVFCVIIPRDNCITAVAFKALVSAQAASLLGSEAKATSVFSDEVITNSSSSFLIKGMEAKKWLIYSFP